MVGYTSTVREQAKKASRKISNGTFRRNKAKQAAAAADKENQPNNANVTSPRPTKAPKKATSLTKTASRRAGQLKSTETPLQRPTKPVPKTTPPRYTSVDDVDDPFETLRDLPRTPVDNEDGLSPISNLYSLNNSDMIELGPTEPHFLSPILIRYSSPNSSPIKPFNLPTSPISFTTTTESTLPTHDDIATTQPIPLAPLDESHLSEVSLGATPQKAPVVPVQKSASVFDLRANGALDGIAGMAGLGGMILATPRKVVVVSGSGTGGKRKRTFSPSKQHPDLTLADMLHDLSFGTDDQDDIPVAEDVAEVSKEEFLWSMKSGFEFLKHGRRGKPHKRLVWFELDKGAICWTESGRKKKIKTRRMMFLHEVVDIVYGTATAAFARRNPDPNLCFSIISQKRTLDLECSNQQVRDFWMSRFYLLKILQHELHSCN